MSKDTATSTWQVGRHTLRSRLIIGTGKYESFEQNLACAEAAGAEMVTVALRRVNFDAAKGPRLLDVISPERFTILPNTAGCYTAEEAITTARMGRELLDTDDCMLILDSARRLAVVGNPVADRAAVEAAAADAKCKGSERESIADVVANWEEWRDRPWPPR